MIDIKLFNKIKEENSRYLKYMEKSKEDGKEWPWCKFGEVKGSELDRKHLIEMVDDLLTRLEEEYERAKPETGDGREYWNGRFSVVEYLLGRDPDMNEEHARQVGKLFGFPEDNI